MSMHANTQQLHYVHTCRQRHKHTHTQLKELKCVQTRLVFVTHFGFCVLEDNNGIKSGESKVAGDIQILIL